MTDSVDWHGSFAETRPKLDPGHPFHVVHRHGTMFAGLYAPAPEDRQEPHRQDEAYVVVAGSARFWRPDGSVDVVPGDYLFVPASMEHRFEAMSDDFAAWAIFWGPPGGESTSGR